jgi:hypothetical protein
VPRTPAFVVHGTLINFLYAGQHEFSHWTVFKTKKLNEIFGRLFGFVLFYPAISTRSSISRITATPRTGRATASWGATATRSPPICSGCSGRPIGTRACAA